MQALRCCDSDIVTEATRETPEQGLTPQGETVPGTMRPVLAALSCLAAAWVMANSTGLLVYPLRRMLVLLCVGVALVGLGARVKWSWQLWVSLALVVGLFLAAVTSPLPPVGIAGIAVVLAFLAWVYTGPQREVLWVSCSGLAVFGLYRAVVIFIPWVWLAADLLGREIGRCAGLVMHRPLRIGATFAGLDFLVLTGTIWLLWLARRPRPRRVVVLYGALAVLGGHLVYLIVLSCFTDLLALLPKPGPSPYVSLHTQQGMQPPWSWVGLLQKAVPWNLPALAGAVHLTILAALFRWAAWIPATEVTRARKEPWKWRLFAGAGACLLPVVTGLCPIRLDLANKTIVFYNRTVADWGKPTHGQYGMYSGRIFGMLPAYAESLGASVRETSEVAEEDLQDADLLVVSCPGIAWTEGQLQRIGRFVRQGGSLLLLAEHTTHDSPAGNRSSELLSPTGMRVPYDSALFAVRGWDQSYEPLQHPIMAGLRDDHNQFGVFVGASLDVRWPACPLLAGRWGWADLGDRGNKQGELGDWNYNPGEKLGDVILMAEQRLGKGRVITFGDTSSMLNTTLVHTHEFTARVLGYLAHDAWPAHAWWRQLPGILLAAGVVVILVRRVDVWSAGLVAIGLAGSLVVCIAASHNGGVYPPHSGDGKCRVAYIDATHVEAYWDYLWRPDDIAGLVLTLMRNNYLPFALPRFTADRLQGAQLLISIAPSRAFSKNECRVVRDFVTQGGTFLITAGYEESAASRSILSEFGFTIGGDAPAGREPDPMGRFKSPYLQHDDRHAYVRFHCGWPVTCNDPNAQIIANGRQNLPVILRRKIGDGNVVVIGDTGFLMNKNLEREDGQPIEGQRENADFCRWLFPTLRGEEMWIPPSLCESGPTKTDGLIPGQPLSLQGVQP